MDRLNEILSTMDIPENRLSDWAWLLRNLWVRNGSHPDFSEAQKLVVKEYKQWIRPKPIVSASEK
jgi:hypothetical protein